METHSNERVEGPIDYPITDKEFEAAINKLKASKSPGINNILKGGGNKNRKGSHERAFSTLFNPILDTGKYPALWSFAASWYLFIRRMIDPKSKITEVSLCFSALGKIFTSVLNNRLHEYMVQKGILKAEQCCFRKMHGTIDSIFTLKTLIDKYVTEI